MVDFDLLTTAGTFVALILLGVGALLAGPMMTAQTVLTMVLPSMAIFGAICLAIGVKHGEYRASGA